MEPQGLKNQGLKSLIIAPYNQDSRPVREAIRDVLRDNDIEIILFDDIGSPGLLGGDIIVNYIVSSDLIIVDVTDQNPNVMYELGVAHGLRKETILVMSEESQTTLPADLRGYLYFVYDPNDLMPFQKNLAH